MGDIQKFIAILNDDHFALTNQSSDSIDEIVKDCLVNYFESINFPSDDLQLLVGNSFYSILFKDTSSLNIFSVYYSGEETGGEVCGGTLGVSLINNVATIAIERIECSS